MRDVFQRASFPFFLFWTFQRFLTTLSQSWRFGILNREHIKASLDNTHLEVGKTSLMQAPADSKTSNQGADGAEKSKLRERELVSGSRHVLI